MFFLRAISLAALMMMTFISHANSTEELENMLKASKGQVVYLDFWASWCGPCRKSFPWLNEMQAKYKEQGFKVISVNVDAEHAAADKFLQTLPAHFTVIYDPKGNIARQFKLKGMPSSYIFNKQGKIVSAHVGFIENKKRQYETEISSLIKEK